MMAADVLVALSSATTILAHIWIILRNTHIALESSKMIWSGHGRKSATRWFNCYRRVRLLTETTLCVTCWIPHLDKSHEHDSTVASTHSVSTHFHIYDVTRKASMLAFSQLYSLIDTWASGFKVLNVTNIQNKRTQKSQFIYMRFTLCMLQNIIR